ncbi:MAG: hypothetical protein WCG92_26415 [Hyphomicrobiales bacterium]|nr:hypothetical protein [Alphaproteobacteria bacterium]
MLARVAFALSAALLIVAPALAQDCPAEGSGWEGREDAVRKAGTCNAALKVAESCAYGATGDTGLTNIVIEKCEADFSARMSKAQRRSYDRGIKACDERYRRKEGTMYRSMAAFCWATLARDTAAKFAQMPRRK